MILSTNEIASEGYIITPFIAVSMILNGVTTIFYNILALKKKTFRLGIIWTCAAFINIIFTIILVHMVGIIGGPCHISIICIHFNLWIFSNKAMNIDFDYSFLKKCILASLIMSAIILAWSPVSAWELIAEICLCATVYFAALYSLGGIDKNEIRSLIEIFHRV